MKCPYCGNEVKDDINFCPVCGNSLESLRTPDPEPACGSEPAGGAETVYCPFCGGLNPADARFCVNCGSDMYTEGAENGGNAQPEQGPSDQSKRRRIILIVIIAAACAAAAILITFSLIRRNNIRNTSAAWVEESDNLAEQGTSGEDLDERELALEDITEVEDSEAASEAAGDESSDTDFSDSSGTSESTASSSSSESEVSESESEVTGIPFNMSDVTTVYSSSFLDEPEYGTSHPASNVVDGSLDNAWSEGVSGQGVGEYVIINFNNIYQLNGMTIYSGYQKSEDLYYKNSRPKEIRITFADESYEDVTLEDVMGEQTVTFSHPVSTPSVEIMILSVYPGSKYQDTLISEVSFY